MTFRDHNSVEPKLYVFGLSNVRIIDTRRSSIEVSTTRKLFLKYTSPTRM
jgi:hypothetical protein